MKFFTKEAASAAVKWLTENLGKKPFTELAEQAKKMNLPANKRVKAFDGGGEGVASVVTDPKLGLKIEKTYDTDSPFVSAASLRAKKELTDDMSSMLRGKGHNPDDYIVPTLGWSVKGRKPPQSYHQIAQTMPSAEEVTPEYSNRFMRKVLGKNTKARDKVFEDIRWHKATRKGSDGVDVTDRAFLDVHRPTNHNVVNDRIIDFLPGPMTRYAPSQRVTSLYKKTQRTGKHPSPSINNKKSQRRMMEFERLVGEHKNVNLTKDLDVELTKSMPNWGGLKNLSDFRDQQGKYFNSFEKLSPEDRLNNLWKKKTKG